MSLRKEIEKAVMLGDLEYLRSLIGKDVKLNFKDEFGRTLIYDAIVNGKVSVVELLCQLNIDVNNQDSSGKTPLHFAAIHRQHDIADILIKNHADVNLKDNNGNNPLFDAVFNCKGNTELVNLLIINGADFSSSNKFGVSPKQLAEKIVNFDISDLFK